MTKRVLISLRVCTDRCLQSRAVSAAMLPCHRRAHTCPWRTWWASVGLCPGLVRFWATGQCNPQPWAGVGLCPGPVWFWATGQHCLLPWASEVLHHWPACWGCWFPTCPALLTAVKVQSSIRAYTSNRLISEALASLSGGISDCPHLQRTIPNSRADPAPAWCPEQPSALQQRVRAPLPGWCSLFLCLAVQPWNGTCLHGDLLPANNIFLFSNKKLKKFTSLL